MESIKELNLEDVRISDTGKAITIYGITCAYICTQCKKSIPINVVVVNAIIDEITVTLYCHGEEETWAFNKEGAKLLDWNLGILRAFQNREEVSE